MGLEREEKGLHCLWVFTAIAVSNSLPARSVWYDLSFGWEMLLYFLVYSLFFGSFIIFGIAVAAVLIDLKIRPLIFSVPEDDNNNTESWRDDLDELLGEKAYRLCIILLGVCLFYWIAQLPWSLDPDSFE